MSQDPPEKKDAEAAPAADAAATKADKSRDRVRHVTRIVLAVCAVVFVWYVVADRLTPYTDQARIRAITVPITPRVAGYLTTVNVRLHSLIKEGELMFQLDQRPFVVAVEGAEAQLDQTAQSVGAGSASVKSAAARVGVARAQLDRAQRNYNRTRKILDDNPGALSQADWDRTETSLAQATERLASAEADLEKAKEQLGVTGPNNPQIRAAIAALEQAQLDLAFSTLHAPYDGAVESFNMDIGSYAASGQPLATFVSSRDVWIEADMRENNLGRIKKGDRVEFTLDVAPGRVFNGRVRSVGFGVEAGSTMNPGGLPTIKGSQGWMRDPQRFPVIIGLNEGEADGLRRIGGQADVVVYTGGNALFNAIAWVNLRIGSLLSYVR
jgi:multidrug resistance efflux pump